jgi:simple sugar transport system permease protein
MRLRLTFARVPALAPALVCALLYLGAALQVPGFVSWDVPINLLRDNAFLGLCALGMTFVILSGGIDLSVGAMVGCTSIGLATLIAHVGLHPALAIPLVMLAGTAFGAGQGALIQYFRLPPFLVTLGGMFLARGVGFIIRLESVTIRHTFYESLDQFSFEVFPVTALVFLVVLVLAIVVADGTPFGRAVYALGGNETAALLMGLPVARTRVAVYALSGFCAATAGVVYTLYTAAGNATAGTMLELDAIAAVVIGGTLLTGGVGHVAGTFLGVLTYGLIQTIIIYVGTLNSWWTRIAVGALLLVFILLQKLVPARAAPR